MCEISGDIMWLLDSRTEVDITYNPFPLSFKLDIALEMFKDVHGAKKKEFCTLLRRYADTLLGTLGICEVNFSAIVVK